MSKAAPPLVPPAATVVPLTVTLSKLIGWSPASTVFVHSFLPASTSIAATWLQPAVLFLGGILGWKTTAALSSSVVNLLVVQTGPGSLIVHSLVPLSRS